MKKRNLQELKLLIPGIELMKARTLFGGTGYTEDPIIDGGEIPEVTVIVERPEEPELPDHPDDRDIDRDEEHNDDGERGDSNDGQDQDDGDDKPRSNTVEDFNPSNDKQIPGWCTFESMVEKWNHANPDSKMTDADMIVKYQEYCIENGIITMEGLNGLSPGEFADFYEYVFGEGLPDNFVDGIDNGEVGVGWYEYDSDGDGDNDGRHAIVIYGYEYDEDGNLRYQYWDPETGTGDNWIDADKIHSPENSG